MPPKYQSRPPLQQSPPPMPSSHSYTIADDDDDICPVCESECTCNSSARVVSLPSPPPPPPHNSNPLKIRLTVPPALLSSLHSHSNPREKTTSAVAHDGGAHDLTTTTSLPPPKKRGRPTKAEAAARRAAAALRDQSLPRQRRDTASTKAARKIQLINYRQNEKKQQKQHLKRVYGNSSTESDTEDKVLLPTYISTFSADPIRDRVGDDSDCSDLSSLPDPGDDSGLEEEETRYVIREEHSMKDKARVRRELLGSKDAVYGRHLNSWEFRPPSRASVPGDSVSASDSSTESDEEDANDEGEADGDAEDGDGDGDGEDEMDAEDEARTVALYSTPAGRFIWDDSEDEDLDADIFFASLSDSETSTSGFEQVYETNDENEHSPDAKATPLHAIPFDDADAAGLLSPLARLDAAVDIASVLVTKDWDGVPIFTSGNDINMGLLDIDFELSVVAQHQANHHAGRIPGGGDDDEEMWIQTDEEDGADSGHGDTTDDEGVAMRGVQTPSGIVLFRFPTPPVAAIDPLSTVSPINRKKSSSAKRHKRFEKSMKNATVPKVLDILANSTGSLLSEDGTFDDINSFDGASSISSFCRYPSMGSFDTSTDSRHFIINDSSVSIPSPVPPTERQRRGSGASRGRKRSIKAPSNSLRSPLASRSRSKGNSVRASPDPEISMAPLPIALDDVLDSALLESLPSDEFEPPEFTSRFQRVPMGTFRRTRTGGGLGTSLESVMEYVPNQPPPVSDGFCYGSSGGSLMRPGPVFDNVVASSWSKPMSSTEGDKTPTRTNFNSTVFNAAFGNSPPEQPSPKILSHKQRRKEKRKLGALQTNSSSSPPR